MISCLCLYSVVALGKVMPSIETDNFIFNAFRIFEKKSIIIRTVFWIILWRMNDLCGKFFNNRLHISFLMFKVHLLYKNSYISHSMVRSF